MALLRVKVSVHPAKAVFKHDGRYVELRSAPDDATFGVAFSAHGTDKKFNRLRASMTRVL